MKMNKEFCSFMNTISYIMRSDEYYLLHVSKKDDVNRHKILAGYYDDKYVYFICPRGTNLFCHDITSKF